MQLSAAVLILLLSFEWCSSVEGACIDTFYRCDSSINIPIINTTQPHCPLTNEELKRFEELDQCNILPRFTAEIINSYDNIYDVTVEENSLVFALLHCYQNISNSLCNNHKLCLSCTGITQVSTIYTLEACRMKFFASEFFRTDGRLNYELFNKLTLVEAMYTKIEYEWEVLQFETTTTIQYGGYSQAFFHTCSNDFDIQSCINFLVKECFKLKGQGWIFYCQETILNRICSQLRGNDLYMCVVIMEEILNGDHEEACSESKNEVTCNMTITNIFYKPIQQFNYTDLNQIEAIITGGSTRLNHTENTLSLVNQLIEHFTRNESGIATLLRSSNANGLMEVINILLSEERVNILREVNRSGNDILDSINTLSRVIALAVIEGNDRISTGYEYSGNNLYVALTAGQSNATSYQSGNLSMGNNDTVAASINIPSSQICNATKAIYDNSGSGYSGYGSGPGSDPEAYNFNESFYFEDLFFIDLINISCSENGSLNYKNESQNATTVCLDYQYQYDYYTDDYYLSDECATQQKLDQECHNVVATSVSRNISHLLNNTIPTNMSIASLVLTSEIVSNTTRVTSLNENATLHFTLTQSINSDTDSPSCYYWDNITQSWSKEGIKTIVISDTEVQCVTNHLTTFAVLVDHQSVIYQISHDERLALRIVGYAGTTASIICLALGITCMIYFKKQMKTGPLLYIHFNFFTSLLLALVALLVGIAIDIRWICGVVAGIAHYLFLSVFCWMLAEGIMLYLLIVQVFSTWSGKWYLFLPLGWGLPIPIVAITAGVRYNHYGSTNYGCWLSNEQGVIWGFLGPMIAICMVNTFFLILTLIQLVKHMIRKEANSAAPKHKHLKAVKSAILGTIVLLPLLGTTWIVGIFAIGTNSAIFLWIFTICNSFQGVAVFILHVLRNQGIWRHIRKYSSKKGSISFRKNQASISKLTEVKTSSMVLELGRKSSNYNVTESDNIH